MQKFKTIVSLLLILFLTLATVPFGTQAAEGPAPLSEGIIQDFVINDAAYAALWSLQKDLQEGDTLFGDRSFLIDSLPPELIGSQWIRSANDSKKFNGEVLLSFTVTEDADVFVAHDVRIVTKPTWLKDWEDTGKDLADDGAPPASYRLFKKSFTKGSVVSLGANGQSSGCCMYTTIVRAKSAANKPAPTPRPKPEFKRIILQLDNPKMTINSKEQEVDPGKGTAPTEVKGRTLLPIRSVVEALGGSVDWADAEKKTTIKLNNKVVEIWEGNKTIKVNGADKKGDVEPQTINGRTFVPLRVVAEGLGCVIGWDHETKAIIVSFGENVNTSTSIKWDAALAQKKAWYGSDEAIRIADNVLLYQRNDEGWHKGIDMAVKLKDDTKEQVISDKSKNDSTVDNEATTTQLKYLAKVYSATRIERYKDSFYKGLDALLAAQYANGGWAQYLKDTSGYRSQVTYNDNAMLNVVNLLTDISKKKDDYTFVSSERVVKIETAIKKAIDCILKTQIVVNGQKTAWCAQYDHVTLTPAQARAYELPSISGMESVAIVKYLMSIENPSPEVIDAVQTAIAWFDESKLLGIKVVDVKDPSFDAGFDKVVQEDPTAPPVWARFYDIETNKPFFVGRDSVKKDTLAEIEQERRTGYAYYIYTPATLLSVDYPAWQQKWAPKKNVLLK